MKITKNLQIGYGLGDTGYGYYICGICGHWVLAEEVTLDHIEPRTHENMFLASNIQPAHGYCNYNKGSKRWNA